MTIAPLLVSIIPQRDPDAVPLLSGEARPNLDLLLLTVAGEGPSSVVRPADLGITIAPYRFALRDDDLVSFLKPRFLTWVMRQHPGREVLYVDPACMVTDHEKVRSYGAPHDITLFPTLPPDLAGAKVSTTASLARGLGVPTIRVLGLRPGVATTAILDSWREWIDRAYSMSAVTSLTDAEQRYLATLPGSHPAAAWDTTGLFGRWSDLPSNGPRPAIVGMEGAEEHLTREDPSQELLTTRLAGRPGFADLIARYADLEAAKPVVYRSGATPTQEARSVFRGVDPHGHQWPDPADDTAPGNFRAWLETPDGRGLPRIAQAIYWTRPDLWNAFPASRTAVATLTDWMRANSLTAALGPTSPTQKPLADRVRSAATGLAARAGLPTVRTLATARPIPTGSRTGVNLIGFATAGTGLGVAMRSTIRAVSRLDVPHVIVDASDRIFAPAATASPDSAGCYHDVSIYHLNPREILDYAEDTLAYRNTAAWNIGFWFWETDQIPDAWKPALGLVDEIWVSSAFVAAAFERETRKPISVVGLPVMAPPVIVGDRRRFGLPADDFLALFVADAFSSADRKNPFAAIEAFRIAFGPGYDGVHLALKIGNLGTFPRLGEQLVAATTGMPVTLLADTLDEADLWRLTASADAYLSLHAAEGLGLTILEAMAAGVPTVVTGFGGSMDFTTQENSMLVGYESVAATGKLYGGHGSWAKPDPAEAAVHLKRLHDDADLRHRLSEAGRSTAARLSPEVFAAAVAARLRRIGFGV